MVLKGLYGEFQHIDGKVLQFYRKYAERWEARGHGRYGLPALYTTFFSSPKLVFHLNFADNGLNLIGFLATTPEPEKPMMEDIGEYRERKYQGEISFLRYVELTISREAVAITTPFRRVVKLVYTSCFPIPDGGTQDLMNADLCVRTFRTVNNHLRLPMLAAGVGFLGKAGYDAVTSWKYRGSIDYGELQDDLKRGIGFLLTASSAYFKDSDTPISGKKRRSLRDLITEAYESVRDKLTIKVPQPVNAGSHRTLEDFL